MLARFYDKGLLGAKWTITLGAGCWFLLYAVYRGRYAAGFHAAAQEENTVIGTCNTALLLTSTGPCWPFSACPA